MSIKLDQLTLHFQGKELFSLSHEFSKGTIHLIKGPSGCGKSTLLRLIAGLSPAHSGKILIAEKPISNQREHRLRCQYLFQQAVIFPGSVRDNLLYPFEFCDKPKPTNLEAELARLFPESISLDQEAKQLSVGQKQRLALLRALLVKPDFLLCDEVSSGLDETSRQLAEQCLADFCTQGGCVLFVTHIEKSFDFFDRLISLEMTPHELRTHT